jgi:hypothetical protein
MGLVGSAARVIRRQSVRRGLFGGNRAWMTIGGLYTVVRVMRRIARGSEGVLVSERIKPGETLVIEAHPSEGRRARRRARRDA